MNTLELKARLQQPYERENWIEVAKDVFHNLSILEKPLEISGKPEFVKSFQQLGFVNLHDGRNLAMIEIIVDDTKNLARNKVQLRNLTNKLIDEHSTNGVLVIYDNESDSNYRFTFASRESVINEQTGEFEKKETNAKRFTYLLGPGESCTTAATQLTEIANKGGNAGMKDVIKAFNVEKVNKEFFNGYKKQYEAFVEHLSTSSIKASVFNGDEKAIRDFAKKMLGRIVFIYFLQKKGWMGVPEAENGWANGDKDFLKNLFLESGRGEDYYAVWLSKVFFDTLNNNNRMNDLFELPNGTKVKVPYLNGGLFEAENNKTALLTFPSELFDSLFEFFSQYNFTIYEDDPEERFLAVDPEMLGHIFENLLEDNKDKGAFYTPKEIVHYMCRESLIEYLNTKLNPTTTETYKEIGKTQTDLFGNKAKKQLAIEELIRTPKEVIKRESIEKLVLHHEAAEIINFEKEILKALYDVKICDPAIGSGAFPMGLLTEIFQLIETLHNITPDVTAEVWKLGNDWNPATVKKQIIQNSIYGVDIEKGAVDIARLRFWLSLVIDEEAPNRLPNLDYKIVVGNSLLSKFEDEIINIDWDIKARNASAVENIINDQQAKLVLLTTRQREYFQAGIDKTKQQLRIRDLKIDILKNQLTLNRIQFEENNQMQLSMHPTTKESKAGESFKEKIRNYNRTINELDFVKKNKDAQLNFFDWKLNFPEVMKIGVATKKTGFDIVIANPPYVLIKKEVFLKDYSDNYIYQSGKPDLYRIFIEKAINLGKKGGNVDYIIPNTFLTIPSCEKLRRQIIDNFSINSILNFDNSVFDTVSVNSIVLNFTLSNEENNSMKILNLNSNQDIYNYSPKITKQSLVKRNSKYEINIFLDTSNSAIIKKITEKSMPLKEIPEIYLSLGAQQYHNTIYHEDVIKKRGLHSSTRIDKYYFPELGGKSVKRFFIKYLETLFVNYKAPWYTKPEFSFFEGERIILREIVGNQLIAGITEKTFIANKSCYIIKSNNKHFTNKLILGILNSKLMGFYVSKTGDKSKQKLFPRITMNTLKSLPISTNLLTHKLEKKIDELIQAQSNNQNGEMLIIETEIDLIVYKLYDLTFSEACIVENNDKWLGKEEYEKFEIK